MRETRSSHVFRWVTIAVLTVFTVVPLYVMITSSVKPLSEVQSAFTWWPQTITFQPFIDMWSTVPLASYFVNSLIVSSAATLISLVIAVFAAYAVSRYRFKGRNVFTTTVLSTQMFPGVLFLLPLFLIFVNINQATGIQLVGTRWGLIITYFTFVLPFSIWMLAGYFDGIPRDLDEAAKVDGSGPMGALWHVVLPAARPGLIAVAIYSFMTSWGEVLFASVMTTDENRTLAVGLQLYSTQTNVYWNQIMAASLVVSIPIVVAFLLLQRNFVAGLTAGAVK
ncbi:MULTISPECIES: carbohydrate ABC transporter permease [Leifsonia]|uniref:Multiple sugar transport system permease protein n=1 Tax=Leifsonia soli TaxID=582665 RepID=A0A852SZ53_9MICO|nr:MULTISPECIES: carbohydrate ABC transporter permease [Leifsonia]MDR6614072.1 multiple sugar transport system permease protein [Leifsonia sp. 1010]NYD73975.1 multiple sugar transport system permease protein [Leifsonia soli]TDP99575.1 carbohydrate ABC transporter membrane protein 2 (CUT1 family) [Leifsonia sp. 115AMFTsu3.1]SEA68784.1 carbohydrate ABC transporter membrane protein 2, CUT1 family [Leifsonia sp. 21MFCrub1.1]